MFKLKILRNLEWTKKLFLLSIFLLGSPPITLGYDVLNTHTLSKLIWLVLFFWLLIRSKSLVFGKVVKLFLLFFMAQSLSILNAVSIGSFLVRYEDLIFSGILVLIASFYIKNHEDVRLVLMALFFSGLVGALFQLLLLVFGDRSLHLLSKFLSSGYEDIVIMNLNRNRLYLETYNESLIPILLLGGAYGISSKKQVFLAWVISGFSFVSNFRSRFVMTLLSWGGYVVFRWKKTVKLNYKYWLTGAMVIVVLNMFSMGLYGYSVIDRMMLTDLVEDVSPIYGRFTRWEKAFEMGVGNPVLGVGLGNYYDNLIGAYKFGFRFTTQSVREFDAARYYPHNVFYREFAETGLLGLGVVFFILFSFIFQDVKNWRKSGELYKGLAVGFWVVFSYSLFNPAVSVVYISMFWIYRIMISVESGA